MYWVECPIQGHSKKKKWTKTIGIFHLPKDSRNSSSKVNGTQLFVSFQWKISGSNGTSEKVVLFSIGKFSDGNSWSIYKLYQFQAICGHIFNLGMQNCARMEPARAAWERMELVSNGTRFLPDGNFQQNFRNFWINGKCLM